MMINQITEQSATLNMLRFTRCLLEEEITEESCICVLYCSILAWRDIVWFPSVLRKTLNKLILLIGAFFCNVTYGQHLKKISVT
jgi:hypothetical protein